jgi:hypothetical protein
MSKKSIFQLIVACAMLLLAASYLLSFVRNQRSQEPTAYFYDLSERKLFVAAQSAVPPIRGLNDDQADAMRAVVIAASGKSGDKSAHKIAYLEKYSSDFKQDIQAARKAEAEGKEMVRRIGRSEAQSHTFVRRLTDSAWYPLSSPEGEKIVTEWNVAGPDGNFPEVCVP